jgi:hypothetical protein
MESPKHLGIRGDPFRNFIKTILTKGLIKYEKIDELLDEKQNLPSLPQEYEDNLLSESGLSYYSTAFTHKSADPYNNYEFYETLGDATLKKTIRWYISYRFPHINHSDGSDILTKLAIKLEQTKNFANLARKLGFLDYITRNLPKWTEKEINKMLEDVFEAFFGVTELLLNKKYSIGVGYEISYRIFSNLMDLQDIPINYEYLVDSITRMKELIDIYTNNQMSKVHLFKDKQNDLFRYSITILKDNVIPQQKIGDKIVIGSAKTEIEAAETAYQYMKQNRLTKPVPIEYVKYCV